jgi:superfamily I DNA/RNA helicase
MLKSQVVIGERYTAKVSGRLVTVRLTGIQEGCGIKGNQTYYDAVNEATGRRLKFRSAARFRNKITTEPTIPQHVQKAQEKAHILASTPLASLLQSAIDREQSQGKLPHLIVKALAGTGKTTTAIEGVKAVKGLQTSINPSEQQRDIWDSMLLSKDAKSMALVAFSRAIADELKVRMPLGCEAMTMHSMGYKAVMRAFGRLEVNKFVVLDIIADILGADARDLRKNQLMLVSATEDLVGHCKKNLCDGTNREELETLCAHYQIDLNGSKERVFDLVPKVLSECHTPKGRITFDDMIWLPVIHNLPLFRYDLLIVDEAQDLNRCQQVLAKLAGNRLMLIGDENQAIFGFAGADCDSLPRMERELSATERGCVTLPLTVTRRCGKAIVTEAQKIVTTFAAHESNHDGIVRNGRYVKRNTNTKEIQIDRSDYRSEVQDGDFIICRVNSPLISECFRFLKEGKRANIQGRDIGAGLVSTIKRLNAKTMPELMEKLSDWYHKETTKENAKRNPNEIRLIGLQDRYDCLCCFTEGMDTIEAVINRIETVFTDDGKVKGIRLSSIHKAKGLEAKRVFFLQPEGASCPHPMARSEWQRKQEWNLLYVGITRAIEELVYVS